MKTTTRSHYRQSTLFVAILTLAAVAAIPASQALATPADGGLLEFAAANYSVAEDAFTDTITVSRLGSDAGTVTVDYTTVDGTAIAGSDYTTTTGTITFADGDSSESFTVPILNDSTAEGDEAFYIVLSNPTNDAALSDQATATVRITDNDNAGHVEFYAASYAPGEDDFSTTITVSRYGQDLRTGTVAYATVDGTAVAGSDYAATSGTLTFVGSDTSESFTVPILNDSTAEGDEAFYIALLNPTGGVALADQATTTVRITDDDNAGFVEFSAQAYAPSEDDFSDTITVRRFGQDARTVTVDYTTVDGTATSGSDYTATSGTLTFVGTDTSESFTVPILNDTAAEGDEAFYIALSNPTGGAALSDQATTTVRITDDDNAGFVEFSAEAYAPSEGDFSDTITVRRFGQDARTVTVDYTTVDGTAVAGSDYTATSGTLTFTGGDSSESFTVPILNDAATEGDEAFYIVLSNPTGGGALSDQATTTIRIRDNDAVSGDISCAETRSEPENGFPDAVTVTRTGSGSGAVSIDYTVVDITATNATDYTLTSGTVSWSNGETGGKPIAFTPINDALIEGTETFQVVLSNPTGGATLDDRRIATVYITDDDPPGNIGVSPETVSEPEDGLPAAVTVRRTEGNQGTVTIDYTVVDITATNATDYALTSGTVSWLDGETGTKPITFTPINDALIEGAETFQVVLSNPTGGATLDARRIATVTIEDDDPPGHIGVSSETRSEPEDGIPDAVTVSRSEGSRGLVSIDYTVVDITATNAVDYALTSGTLTWLDGETASKSVPFTPIDDSLVEGDETFQVVLSNPTGGATLDDRRIATVTIEDDDPPGHVGFSAETRSEPEDGVPDAVTVTRTEGDGGTVTIDYTVVDITATNATDYTLTSGTLTWPDGVTASQSITFTPIDDSLVEGDETFQVVLSNPTGGATLDDRRIATVTINDDDDERPGELGFLTDASSADEDSGPVSFTVLRLAGSAGAASVDYSVAPGTATPGVDYTPVSGTFEWFDGEFTERTVNVPVLDDSDWEDDETFTITLTNFTGAGAGSITSATGTIVDDDALTVGLLRVTTDPAVPSQVLVDGLAADTWGLTWVKLAPGDYEVSFTDIQGFTTPAPQLVTLSQGVTTLATGSFAARGWLQVTTSPAMPATIYVDGAPMNDWGVWTDLEPGSYEVCFGAVADHATPACETAVIVAGANTPVTGVYVSDPGAPGPSGHGYLRVTTNPAVPAQILIDGVPRDSWGLNWVKLDPGTYDVSFTDIGGFTTPPPESVTITAGEITVIQGDYTERGWLQVVTSPPLPGTIYVDGNARNDWGMWTDLEAAGYEVCFGDVPGHITPACETTTLNAGAHNIITGTYTPNP